MDLGSQVVLVTGAAGWLGRGLVRALAHGLPDCEALREPQQDLAIRCLVYHPEDEQAVRALGGRTEVVVGDVRRPGDCERLCSGAAGAVLFHAAGVVHPRFVRELYAVNVAGTRHVLAAAAAAGVRRAVVVSSNSPCGCNRSRDGVFDERSPYRPYMNYGRSKMRMEQAAAAFQAAGQLETVVVRAPWFYGPHQPARQTRFFRMVRDGKAPIVGDGGNLRSMAYIDNLAQGLLLAAVVEEAAGQTYWVADERPYTMNEIVDTIERLLEAEFGQPCAHRRLRLPGFVSGLAWLADATLQALGLYHQKIHVLSEMNKTIACSIEKARAELGYRPAVALEEGMRRSLAWCMETGGLDSPPRGPQP